MFYTRRATILTFILALAAVDASAQTKTAFPNPLSPAYLVPSPSAHALAVTSKTVTHFYTLAEDGSTWTGPYAMDYGYHGSADNIQRSREWPPYSWLVREDGLELFFPRTSDSVAGAIGNDTLEVVESSAGAPQPLVETTTGRLRQLVYSDGQSQSVEEILDKVHYFDGNRTGFVSREAIRSNDLPPSIYMLSDVSPGGNHLLCRPTMKDPIVGLDLRTGDTTSYEVHEHPRIFPDYMTGRYSPDGKYVLMTFSYSHDDHYSGSHIQIFSVDGEFVRELVAFGDRLRGAEWLHNGWIVYAINDEIVFEQFTP